MLSELAREHIKRLSDQELAEYIATGEQMYEPAAVNFAREEWSARSLDPNAVSELESKAKVLVQAETAVRELRAEIPLDSSGKVLACVGGLIGIASLPFAFRVWVKMDIRGETCKAHDTKRWFMRGFMVNVLFWVVLIAVTYSRWKQQHPGP
jgi:F0F1-type ATP synthase assembly protein I